MQRIETALETTGYLFAAFAWDRPPKGDYGTYTISEGRDFVADGVHCERGTIGYIDYFTRDTSSEPRERIEQALRGVCAFAMNSVQYENDTNYIHYEWRFALYG